MANVARQTFHAPIKVAMAIANLPTPVREIEYPESDGQPMAENTLQFQWIVTIQGGLDAQFASDPNVFVAGDLLWYPTEGRNDHRVAPDVMVIFGRPKGYRGRYLQWVEENIAPQVVFEILSPGNTGTEMSRKFHFYERHGVEEYYLFDPSSLELTGWRSENGILEEVVPVHGWTSPRLGIRFELGDDELRLYHPNGDRFKTFVELSQAEQEARLLAAYETTRANEERERADQEQQRADQERQRADQEQQRADQEQQRADQEQQRAERLAAKLRALGVEPNGDSSTA